MNEHKKPGHSSLRSHCDFFDRDGDGMLSPSDTFRGFRALGFGLLWSSFSVIVLHLFLALPSQDSWLSKDFYKINLKNIHKCKHGSDSQVSSSLPGLGLTFQVYDRNGMFDEARFNAMWKRSDPEDTGKLGIKQLINMMNANRDLFDIFGWMAVIMEWGAMWMLLHDKEVCQDSF